MYKYVIYTVLSAYVLISRARGMLLPNSLDIDEESGLSSTLKNGVRHGHNNMTRRGRHNETSHPNIFFTVKDENGTVTN
ncbi:hypothetical protein EB796_000144 [Bugula neritina]|uniref:Uncharacterized protein n=1 Tax=Bugula neritina TaxID=10212 RepID=A0A7J7KTL4_BUGNE|nr:hypothetical protein EB796_000144 [Bugula neritina]